MFYIRLFTAEGAERKGGKKREFGKTFPDGIKKWRCGKMGPFFNVCGKFGG
jgi:hypothetical protein